MSIQALDRAVAILNLFRHTRNPLGIYEMADALDLARTTVHGLVSTLEKNGFLLKDVHSRKYRLGFALFELGSIQADNLEINRQAFQPLQHLSNETGVVCRLAIWDRGAVLVTMSSYPQGHETLTRQLGPRLPAYCTALGKAMLAFMPESETSKYLSETELQPYTPHTITDRHVLLEDLVQIRKRGFSISRQEILLHQAGLGAPIMEDAGRVIGAISARLNPEDLDTDFMTQTGNRLMRTTYRISMDMGYRPTEMNPKIGG